MAKQDLENPLVVAVSCGLAVAGVVAMRTFLGMDHRHWAVAYLAMALTASIRRTSAGHDFSTWSAWRGVACLVAGLYACQCLGYPLGSCQPSEWLPEEVTVAIARIP